MGREYYEKEADALNYFTILEFTPTDDPSGEIESEIGHFHDATEFIFAEKGRAEIVVDGIKEELSEGDVCAVAPYRVHYVRYKKNSKIYAIIISSAYMKDFLSAHNRRFFPFLLKRQERCAEKLARLMGVCTKKEIHDNSLLTQGFTDMFLGILSEYYPLVEGKDYKSKNFIEILQYIESNYWEKITLESAAAVAGYTPSYFSALFYRYVGQHFCDYLNAVRYRNVEILLSGEGKSQTVASAAFDCGFESVNTYYRVKRKIKNHKI